ncbi:large ribosomal subunit protein bL9m-like isoform X3 [Poecile atricapillus]|uniref:large ribosomal subunit protein bL9m-like isoform X3 n=1 Tax=Poecile atricapillus TaxID=48891 RepID=UPI002738B842|nr:large ribosomal subunit protein bL9m-like isoform X3 [Poecile atricapillus]
MLAPGAAGRALRRVLGLSRGLLSPGAPGMAAGRALGLSRGLLSPGAPGMAAGRALGLSRGLLSPGAPGMAAGRALSQGLLRPGTPGVAAGRALSLSPGLGSVVVERVWPVPLARLGAAPRLHPRRHRVFRLLRDGKHLPRSRMELLLTRSVQGVGRRGAVVSVGQRLGRNRLLPQGLAVYPTPENLRIFQDQDKLAQEGKLEELQTPSGQKTLEFLRRCRLQVGMKNNVSWELSPDIVARHFLKNVNGLDTVRVPMDVVQFLRPKTKRFWHWREQQRQQLERSREQLL